MQTLRKSRLKTRRHKMLLHRSGAAVVEFAIVAPVMILLTMGMMEVGRLVMVKQLLVNASREGARLAALPGATAGQVLAQVQTELTGSTISKASVTVTPSELASATAGTPVTVNISVQAKDVSWIPNPVFSLTQTLTASTTMRRESQ
jgi:Flp pilus assembly protein TadG